MSDSSESDIIQRSKHAKRRVPTTVDHLFDSSESYNSEEVSEQEYDPVFLEVFGTGNEYAYIYNSEVKDEKDKTEVKDVYFNIEDCKNYVTKTVCEALLKDIGIREIERIHNGYSPEFIAFHCNKSNVRNIYMVKDAIEEYKEYLKNGGPCKSHDSFRSFSFYKGEEHPINIPGILDVKDYAFNLIAGEKIHEPVGDIVLGFDLRIEDLETEGQPQSDNEWPQDYETTNNLNYAENPISEENINNKNKSKKELLIKYFQRLINQISNNAVFRDRVYRHYEYKIIDPNSTAYDSNSLARLFTTDTYDINNVVRKIIIEEAFNRVSVNEEELNFIFELKGFGEGALQKYTDLIISLKGRGKLFGGLFLDKGTCKVLIIDDYGEISKRDVFKENEIEQINDFFSGIEVVGVTSTNANIKYIIQNMKGSALYVPRSLAFFSDYKDFSIPYSIALVLQSPEIYFSRLYYSLVTRKDDIQISRKESSLGINFSQLVDREDMKVCLKKAISISAACRKMDWKYTLEHKYGFALLYLLGIKLTDKYFDYEKISRLENLRSSFDTIEFINVCTYFRLQDSNTPLDRTFVHPKNHSLAITLCKGAFHRLETEGKVMARKEGENEMIESVLKNPEYIAQMDLPEEEDSDPDFVSPNYIRDTLTKQKEQLFTGATDLQIFNEVVPILKENETYSAVIKKVGKDFYLADISGATIYIKKSDEIYLNQMVDVRIVSTSPGMLSYIGEFIFERSNEPERFKLHPLYRPVDQSTIQALILSEGKPVLLRPSSQQGFLTMVCRVEDNLFYNLRVKEVPNGYEYGTKLYSSIDDFIHKYVKGMFQTIHKIKTFKYYFESEESAIQHVKKEGDYLKYAAFLSRAHSGVLEIICGNKRILIKIDGENLIFRHNIYSDLDEFIRYMKVNYNNL